MPLSPGERKEIFTTLKGALAKCSPPMVVMKDTKDEYALMGNKEVPYGSTKKLVPGMYFSSIVARKDAVSFYYFPIYFHAAALQKLIPTLKKQLKGKTCFAFRKAEQVNTLELNALLKKGVEVWKKEGYMK